MRHPVDRLVSHYVHERTVGRINEGLEEAVERYPELVDYGRYGMQLIPYLETFGPDRVLPVFFRRLVGSPQAELERICRFLGYSNRPVWDVSLRPQNVGSERLRNSALRNVLVQAPVLTPIRQRLIPRAWTEPIKALWRSGDRPPEIPAGLAARLEPVFDDDLRRLGEWLGVRLTCATFRQKTLSRPLEWVGRRSAS
jgi:hypothetical protein